MKLNKKFAVVSAVIVSAAIALTGCQNQAGVDASSAATPSSTPSDSPILLVTFSGEASKGGTPINQVYGLDASANVIPNLLTPGALQLNELRGLTLDSSGNLYVANANKNLSQILKFSPNGNGFADGSVFASAQTTAGIAHPYGLAFGPGNDLLVSSQDSFVVSRVTATGSVVPTGSAWTQAYPKTAFYPGTWAPAGTTASTSNPPAPVPAASGGLTEPRGIAVTGNRLFVADNSSNRVLGYSLTDGSFTGVVASFNAGDPTGLVATADGTGLYVGTQGSNAVHLINIAGCNANCNHTKVVTASSNVPLDSPSGLALRTENGSTVLYVGNRKGNAINRYQLSSPTQVANASVFKSGFTDTPEQLTALN